MSSHDDHNDHHVSETKPVSFITPMILGLVTMLIILLFVSLGDPCTCCAGKCEANSEMGSEAKPEHEASAGEEAHEQHEAVAPKEEAAKSEETSVKEATVAPEAAAPKKEEPKAEEAH